MDFSTRQGRLDYLATLKDASRSEQIEAMNLIAEWVKETYADGRCFGDQGVCCYYNPRSPYESCSVGAFMPLEVAKEYSSVGTVTQLPAKVVDNLVLPLRFWSTLQRGHDTDPDLGVRWCNINNYLNRVQ